MRKIIAVSAVTLLTLAGCADTPSDEITGTVTEKEHKAAGSGCTSALTEVMAGGGGGGRGGSSGGGSSGGGARGGTSGRSGSGSGSGANSGSNSGGVKAGTAPRYGSGKAPSRYVPVLIPRGTSCFAQECYQLELNDDEYELCVTKEEYDAIKVGDTYPAAR